MTTTHPPKYNAKKWEQIPGVQICDGDVLEAYKSIQNKFLHKQILDYKAKLIFGKTWINCQLAHWSN